MGEGIKSSKAVVDLSVHVYDVVNKVAEGKHVTFRKCNVIDFKRAIASDTRFIFRLAVACEMSHKSPHAIWNVPVA